MLEKIYTIRVTFCLNNIELAGAENGMVYTSSRHEKVPHLELYRTWVFSAHLTVTKHNQLTVPLFCFSIIALCFLAFEFL